MPEADEARPLVATLLAAQAAIAALTLAVTLFVMQGVSTKRDADDRMYREYVRQSWVQPIFWGSVAAVGITGLVLLVQEFSSGVDGLAEIAPGLLNLTLIAAISFFANLGLSCALFQRALRLAHPERWSTLRRRVNERDVRASIQAFLDRRRRAAHSLETNEADWSVLLPHPVEGSANEAMRTLLDDALRAMTENRLREYKQSIESIRGLIEDAMGKIEREGISWAAPGSKAEWPPLRELGRNFYPFREVLIREGNNKEYLFGLLQLDYWLTSTGARRRCGDLFTAGLEGYRSNYQIACRVGDSEVVEVVRGRAWLSTQFMIAGEKPEEVFPYAQELVRHQERILSDAVQFDRPDDFERLHKSFEAALQSIRWRWGRGSQTSTVTANLCRRLEQEYRIVLMGLAGRAIDLAEAGGLTDPTRYLDVARGAFGRSDRLAADTAQAHLRADEVRNSQWSDWEWEGAEPGKAQMMNPERYPLAFLSVRLMELSSENMPAINLRGNAKRVLGWFEANSGRLQAYANLEPAVVNERIDLAKNALQNAIRLDEVTEDYRIIESELSAERISGFKSGIYASAFASNAVEQHFGDAGAFVYLTIDSPLGPEEWGYHELEPKGFLAALPADSRHHYVALEGDTWGQGLADDILRRFCEALDGAPEISASLNTPEELLRAFDVAKNQLAPSGKVVAILAGDWLDIEVALSSGEHEGYVPAWQVPGADPIAECGRYRGHTLLSGPRDGDRRMYLLEPGSWGCFVRAQCEGDRDLRIDVSFISADRACELLEKNPLHFSSEPDQESKLRKLQTCVELAVCARIEFRVKDPSRAIRAVQTGQST